MARPARSAYLIKIKMKRYTYYIIALLTLFTACGDVEYEFSNFPCNFVFNNTGNKSAALASAINPNSPGIFCRVRQSGNYFIFDNNQGLSDRVVQDAIDQQATVVLGQYNETGIIIGYGNAGYPYVFYAYDSQCPNCYSQSNGLPRYALTVKGDGTAECGSCGRRYNLNNGGYIIDGDKGDKLIRYNAFVSGDLVRVINK